ncbi:hypothetical protein CEUSTIGMA_g657.t1 [Chlamydomonas eustigma]|uniref:WSC domain-containing protein n=1 Tax=Chlamydomonas eustigma TaxID=1157962 RepID=A0A250WQS1_9CHLO|nr:hypothetical protein CEUSTIGMA_g657.t1 [Chlamydomonas eustigma]|eukprot:GAX73204.1 hypothetical protein CEUSTIGMA_g657.t1 [Chlamydomonas eustigma]
MSVNCLSFSCTCYVLLCYVLIHGSTQLADGQGYAETISGTGDDSSSVTSKFPLQQHSMNATCYLGCYLDDLQNPALPRNMKWYSNTPFTVATCQALAVKRNVTFFATENGTQCLGSNKRIDVTTRYGRDENACNIPCQGNPSQICGGRLAFSLYALGACNTSNYSSFFTSLKTPPVASTPSLSNNTAPVASTPSLSNNTPPASSPSRQATSSSSPTPPEPQPPIPPMLLSPVPQPGTSVTVLSPMISPQPASSGLLNATLAAPNLYNVSVAPSSATFASEATCYLGCFSDDPLDRALPRKMRASLNQTIEACHATAQQKNVSLFALQYGKECWGGQYYSAVQYGASTSCNMTCAGNRTEVCGGR